MVQKPTQPSFAGSIEGTSIDRQGTVDPLTVQIAVDRHAQQHRLEHRDVDVLPCTGPPRREPRAERTHRCEAARDPLTQASADRHRFPVAQTAVGRRPGRGLERELGRLAIGPWPHKAVGRDRENDEGWMGRTQPGDVEAFPAVGFQAMGLDDEIGTGQQRIDVWICGRPDDGLLAGIQEREECGVPAAQVCVRRRPAAQ